MRRGLCISAITVALVLPPTASALLAEQGVLKSARNESNPAADWNGTDSILGWARSRASNPNRYDAFVKNDGAAPVKLNRTGQGFMGGIDYPTVVYQQVAKRRSNLFLYDLSNGTRPATPAGVNTRKWEWHPTVSGDWLLFNRDDTSSPVQRIVLHNMQTGNERLLAKITRGAYSLEAGQVNGDWATYTRCKPVCNVIRYRISTSSSKTLAKPSTSKPRYQYGGSVASDGSAYLMRSGASCGSSVKIVRYGSGDPAKGTVVAALASNKDSRFTHVREDTNGSTEVFYDRVGCGSGQWDIFKIVHP